MLGVNCSVLIGSAINDSDQLKLHPFSESSCRAIDEAECRER